LTTTSLAAKPTPQVSENTKLAKAKLFNRLDIGYSSFIAISDRIACSISCISEGKPGYAKIYAKLKNKPQHSYDTLRRHTVQTLIAMGNVKIL
jgi:hypothetical protein